MLALGSAWIGLATLGIAVTMLVYRPALTDLTLTLVLYFGAPGAMCLGGLVLWAHRKDDDPDLGLKARRLQSKVGIALAIVAAAIVYGLIMAAEPIQRFDAKQAATYNPTETNHRAACPTRFLRAWTPRPSETRPWVPCPNAARVSEDR